MGEGTEGAGLGIFLTSMGWKGKEPTKQAPRCMRGTRTGTCVARV